MFSVSCVALLRSVQGKILQCFTRFVSLIKERQSVTRLQEAEEL